MSGLGEFFFNIVPGAIIILSANILFPVYGDSVSEFTSQSEAFNLVVFTVISLFIGFFLQLLTKCLKEEYIYRIIWKKLANDNKLLYLNTHKFLRDRSLIDPSTPSSSNEFEQVFFTVDNYLSIKNGGGRLLPHFASRSAYWSNVGWASSIIGLGIMLSALAKTSHLDASVLLLFLGISIFLTFISFKTFVAHQEQHYEIALRTFSALIVIENAAEFLKDLKNNSKVLKS